MKHMIIASWGPVHGQCKISVNTALIAGFLALTGEEQVLLLDGDFRYGRLQEIVRPDAEDGVSPVFTLAASENLEPEQFKIHTSAVLERKLYLLGSTRQPLVSGSIVQCLSSIMKTARESYDITMIDTSAGVMNRHTQEILIHSDLVVVNLPHEEYVLERFFAGEKEYRSPELDGKPCIYVVGDYHKEYAHCTIRKLRRKYQIKELYYIPSSRMIHKTIGDQRFLQWLYGSYDCRDKKDEDFVAIQQLQQIRKKMISTAAGKGKEG